LPVSLQGQRDIPQVERHPVAVQHPGQPERKTVLKFIRPLLAHIRPALLVDRGFRSLFLGLKPFPGYSLFPAPHLDQLSDFRVDFLLFPLILLKKMIMADNDRLRIGSISPEHIQTVRHVDDVYKIIPVCDFNDRIPEPPRRRLGPEGIKNHQSLFSLDDELALSSLHVFNDHYFIRYREFLKVLCGRPGAQEAQKHKPKNVCNAFHRINSFTLPD
jgi:hypothetical protein